MSDNYISTMYGASEPDALTPTPAAPTRPTGASAEVATFSYVQRLERIVTALAKRVEALEGRVRTLQQSNREARQTIRSQAKAMERMSGEIEGKIDMRDLP